MIKLPRFYLVVVISSFCFIVRAQVLLKNSENLIPLEHLEQFHLEIYGSVDSLLLTAREFAGYYKEEHIPSRLSTSGKIRIFFVSDTFELDKAKVMAGDARSIICFHGIPPQEIEWADAIIYLETGTTAEVSKMIQCIFGGKKFDRHLSLDAGNFVGGSGIMTTDATRLSFPDAERSPFYQPLKDTLDKIMQTGLDSMAFPGAQLLVLHKGEVAVMEEYGCQSYYGCVPVAQTDLYDMASITKVTTATPALMYLYDQNKINLDLDLCSYFPVLCNSNKGSVPLREALAHQGRLMPYIVYYQNTYRKNGKFKGRTFKEEWSKRFPIKITDSLYLHRKFKGQIDKAIKKSPLNPEPGYVYSGLTFLLYPELIKRLSGERIDSFMYHHFYDRLGATRMTYRPLDRFALDEIVPTEIDTVFRHQLIHGYVHDEAAAMLDGLSCNAGLFANALDLGKYCQMLLNKGTYGGERYLSEKVVEEFTRVQYPDKDNRRGLGFDKPLLEYREGASYVAKSASAESFGHTGFTGTYFWVDPAEEMVFILLTNRVHPTRANGKLYRLGLRPRLHQATYDFLEKR
ncbi:MAG: serine hydrolase [Saprospiraceae bacterium]|nr:serine hydrolase [Saprospiraceae bacterium]